MKLLGMLMDLTRIKKSNLYLQTKFKIDAQT